MKFSSLEWITILDAYAYEIHADPLTSDVYFDNNCRKIAAAGTLIPGFSPDTGQWIFDVIKAMGDTKVLENGYRRYQVLGEGTSAKWLIPKEFLTDWNDSYSEYGSMLNKRFPSNQI